MPPKKSLRQIALEKREAELAVQAHREELKAEGKGTLRHMFLMKDLAALTERRLSSLHAELTFPRGSDYDNITHMKVTISPDEGIYRGGKFEFLIDVPPNYKNEPPKVKCITKHLHPNIQQSDGSVCLNLLRDDWLPSLSLEDVILGLLHLYVAPNPEDPLDHEAAALMRSNPSEFERRARRSCGLC